MLADEVLERNGGFWYPGPMKRPLVLFLSLVVSLASLVAQSPEELYKNRFSYDLKQDKDSMIFDGKTFWLRMSSLKNDALTLTFFLRGETPLNATEMLTVVLAAPGETVWAYSNKLIDAVKDRCPTPPEVILFDEYTAGDQRIVAFLLQDQANNLLQDTMVRMTQPKGERMVALFHSIRMKLSEANANPDQAVARIGDRRETRLQAVTYLNAPF